MLITEAKDCNVHVPAELSKCPNITCAYNQGALNIVIETRRNHELVAESELISRTEPNCGIIQYM